MTNAVLVGVDGSENSLTALRWGARFATLTDRPLVLAYAWQHGRRLEGALSSAHIDAPSLEENIVSQLRTPLQSSSSASAVPAGPVAPCSDR
jgi:nucleotide-binding universal stress UspA family protein